jgi:uncharacterized DUF497 family protein
LDHFDDCFEWDVDKSDDCFKRRNFDFQYASRVFESDSYYEEIDERDYGCEERNICVGRIDDEYYTVVYTHRGTRKRIVSAWLADDDQVRKYVEYFGSPE